MGATLIGTGNSITVSPSTTTVYTATVTGGCIGVSSDQVTVVVSNANVNAGPPVNICQGGSAQLNATSTSTISGWQWTPASSLSNASIQNPVASPAVTTTYVVTATTSSGCTATSSVVVTVTPMTTANAGNNDTVCSGNCTTLTATGGVSYQWAADPSISGPLNSASVTACPTVTTVYHVQVTDANNCVGTDSVTVFVAPTLLSVGLSSTDVTCNGACNGGGVANPAGGYSPYTYLWSNGMTTINATNFCAGVYSVTVTDHIGCTASASVTITEPNALNVQATNITTANCGQNDGSVTISISGGTPNYTVLWPSGGTALTENNLPPGAVSVLVTDSNGCDTTVTFTVPNTPGATVAVVSFTSATCNGSCDGTATAAANGGTSPYQYSWNTSPAQPNATATGLCAGTYSVLMTDSNGCTATASVTITEPPLLTVAVGTNTTICIGQSATLTAQGNGGTPVYNYAWSDGTTIFPVQNPTVSPTVTTTYTCVCTDANNCTSAPQTVTITVNPPLSVNASSTQVVCQNTVVNLSAAGNGGDGSYTYTWTPGPLNGSNITVTATATQQYTVTLTDGCGTPSVQDTVSVIINPAPVPTFTTLTPAEGCEPLCLDFVNTTPNTASLTWQFGSLGAATSSPVNFCFNFAGQYDVTLTVTDVIGCTGTTTVSNYVDVWPLPVADFSANPNPATELNNIVHFTDLSIGATSWIWSFGDDDSASVLQNPVYTFQDTGVYDVQLIVTNSYGCQAVDSMPFVVEQDYALFIPNTFTPNGDGHNDLFFPQGIGLDPMHYTMYIFDRWGNMLYQTSTWPGGWDGTVQGSGQLCQVDTYVYKISTQDEHGMKKVYIGNINLIR